MGSNIDARMLALQYGIDRELEKMIEKLQAFWSNQQGPFNIGQNSIFVWYIEPMLDEWFLYCLDVWPWVDPAEYEDMILSSYDLEVMERAFSECVMITSEEAAEHIYKAQEKALIMEMLEMMVF